MREGSFLNISFKNCNSLGHETLSTNRYDHGQYFQKFFETSGRLELKRNNECI